MALYATNSGRILTDEDINSLSPMDIEQEGIHMLNDWNEWN